MSVLDKLNQDTSVMLCKMRSTGLVKIRVDMISDRPLAEENYQLQGTDGCYESSRAGDEGNRIWLRHRCEREQWLPLEELADEFLPDYYKEAEESAKKAGHGGSDYYQVVDFIEAIQGKRKLEIGIHESMDMTMPGLMSQQSIEEEGRWIDVPDTREW